MNAGRTPIRILRPTLRELWTFLAIALPVLASLLATLPTVDLAYQLRAGAEILAGQGIPSTDSWTFTAAGRPWVDQQWGAQVILAAVFGQAGWTGLAILRAALVGLVSALILLAIRRRAPAMHPRTAALLTLAAFIVTSPALALRPQLLGLVLFAATLVVLAGRRQQPGRLWLLPVLAVAWANLHGSFILAPVLVGLAWAADLHEGVSSVRRTATVTALTVAATLVNPFGIGAWQYALGLATNRDVTARISEWQAPTVGSAFGALFWASVVLVALSAGMLIRRRGRIPWVAVITLAGFAGLGMVTERGIAWWPGVAAVTLAGLVANGRADELPPAGEPAPASQPTPLSQPAPADTRRHPGSVLNAILGAVLVLAGIALIPAWRPLDPGLNAPTGLLGQAPSGLTAALRAVATSRDRVWNPQVWGSWLEFAVPVSLYAFDARIEVIPPEAWANGDLVVGARPGWPEVLDAEGVTIVVTEGPGSTPLARALAASSDWHSTHADAEGSVWIRTDR